jgi:hypothetical protein
MPKHTADKPKLVTKNEKARMRHMASLEVLAPKAIKYLEDCLEAVLPCSYCSVDKEGKLLVAKKDTAGCCIKCHGSNILPDHEARRWATDEVTSRVVPKPKAVELEVDDKREVGEWMEKAESLSDDVVQNLAKELGVVFEADDATDNRQE